MANVKKSSKKTSSTSKNNYSSSKPKQSTPKKNDVAYETEKGPNKQIWAIFIFAIAALVLCLSFIEGNALWSFLRHLLFGLFGICTYAFSPFLIYLAIITAMDKPKIKSKAFQIFILIIMAATALHVFLIGTGVKSFFAQLGELYKNSLTSVNGGAVGGFFGMFFISILGKTGAQIVICILLFIFLMLVTGTTLLSMFGLKKRKSAYDKSNGYSLNKNNDLKFDIDIDLDEDTMPSHPVESTNYLKESSRTKLKQKKPVSAAFDKFMETISRSEAPVDEKIKFSDSYTEFTSPQKKSIDNGLDELLNRVSNKREKNKPIPMDIVSPLSDRNSDSNYHFPPIRLLEQSKITSEGNIKDELKSNAELLVNTLQSFGVETRIVNISRGPTVTRYELQPSAGVKISKITNLADDIALNLAAAGVRIEAPIPNKAAVGIEVPNKKTSLVKIRDLVDTNAFLSSKSKLTVALGKDISGNIALADLAKMPHTLIAGATGSGKSVCINTILLSLLYKSSPDDVRLLMIDPKVVELGIYNGIPHLLVPVVTDPRKAAGALNWAVTEMLGRYKIFADNNVRDLTSYNNLAARTAELNKLPQIVIVIDELADLMMVAPNEVEDSICRLAQMARAAGMHLVIATQRPSVDVITGIIKANIPSRIAFSVSSQVDSRTILDMGGAEKLLGRGDMLFYPMGASKPIRIQGCFVSNNEVESVTDFVKNCYENKYDEQIVEEIEKQAIPEKNKEKFKNDNNTDEMLPNAIECVIEAGEASTSMLQRRLRLGYARAGRLIDEMEQMGIIGPHEGSKPRQLLISRQQWIEMKINQEQEN